MNNNQHTQQLWILMVIVGSVIFLMTIGLVIYLLLLKKQREGPKYQIGGYIYPTAPWTPSDWTIKDFPMTYLNLADAWFDEKGNLVGEKLPPKDFIQNKIRKFKTREKTKLLLSIGMPGEGRDKIYLDVFNDRALVDKLVQSIQNALKTLELDGINVDYEPVAEFYPNEKHKKNFVYFFKKLKQDSLQKPIISITSSSNYSNWSRLYDYLAIEPYIDYFEMMNYFDIIQGNIANAFESFPIPKEKIILGIGLSSYSFKTKASKDKKCPGQDIVRNDYGEFCNGSGCPTTGKYPSWSSTEIHLWNFYVNLIREKKVFYLKSVLGNKIPYLYIPGEDGNGENASILPWNGLDRLQEYVNIVQKNGYGGLFTWITSSDSTDAIFHRAMDQMINGVDHNIDVAKYPSTKKDCPP